MYEQISRNRRASWLLAGLVVAILAMLGFAIGYATIGGTQGGIGLLGVFGVVAIAWSIIGYYSGDKMVLAVSGAHRVTHAEEPQLFNVVEEMTIAAGLPQVPAVYVLDEASPNALATGRDPQHASIAVTRGLLDRLDRDAAPGRDRPRDVARPQLRHPLRDAGRHPGRHDRAHRRLLPALELLGRHGRPPPRRRLGRRPGRRDPRDRRHRAGHPRAARGLRRAVRRVAPPRVPGRRLGRRAHAQPAGPGSRAQRHRRPTPGRCATPTGPRRISTSRTR